MWKTEAQNSTGTLPESMTLKKKSSLALAAPPPAEAQCGWRGGTWLVQGSSVSALRNSQKSVGMELNRKCTLSLALPLLDPVYVYVWIRAGNRTPFWPSAPISEVGKAVGSRSHSANAHRTQDQGVDTERQRHSLGDQTVSERAG